MTLAVKVAWNPNTTNQPTQNNYILVQSFLHFVWWWRKWRKIRSHNRHNLTDSVHTPNLVSIDLFDIVQSRIERDWEWAKLWGLGLHWFPRSGVRLCTYRERAGDLTNCTNSRVLTNFLVNNSQNVKIRMKMKVNLRSSRFQCFYKRLFWFQNYLISYFILSFNYANLHAISPMIYHFWYTTDIFRTKTDIPRIFLENECTFCGLTSRFMTQSTSFMTSLQYVIHFHILLNSCLSVLEVTKLNKSDFER